MQPRRTALSLALALAGALLGSCGMFNKPYPAKDMFAVHVPDASPLPGAPSPEVLRVERIRIAPPFDGVAFVYRAGEHRFESDYYNQFVAGPDLLLTGETVRYLGQAHPFVTVLSPDDDADASLSLETLVTDLYGDFRNAPGGIAYIRARFMLVRPSQGRLNVIGDWTLEATERMDNSGPAPLAAAWGAAYGRILEQLTDLLASTPRAAEPAPAR